MSVWGVYAPPLKNEAWSLGSRFGRAKCSNLLCFSDCGMKLMCVVVVGCALLSYMSAHEQTLS